MAGNGGLMKLDVGELSAEQQEKLRRFKSKTRIDNEKYLRSHPEVEELMADFLRNVLGKRPADIHEFAAVLEEEGDEDKHMMYFTKHVFHSRLFSKVRWASCKMGNEGGNEITNPQRRKMRKCQTKGYPAPEMMQSNKKWNFSNLPAMLQRMRNSSVSTPDVTIAKSSGKDE
ncbi:RIIa domain-containing protein 1 [Liparis tanakae]|uniref:RIIa domain-containing protein 1 n=1 Tax=Liparis tanakae TaxID=230148 RepID=A0A4Z2ICR6_9TELE|nr:RIIa domain-containing protein 1 [Liparis tanakae]